MLCANDEHSLPVAVSVWCGAGSVSAENIAGVRRDVWVTLLRN